MINLLQFKQIFEDSPANLSALWNSSSKTACCSPHLLFTFLCAAVSINIWREQFVSRVRLSFVNFAFYPTPTKNLRYSWASFKQLCLGKHSELETCAYDFFPAMTDTILFFVWD